MNEGPVVGLPEGTGAGPGAFTADGNSVELYARLPAAGEPDVVAGAVPAGGRILELGAGAGRVTHPLVERGYRVVAVDESAAMLAHVRGARTVCSRIEDLHLPAAFDAVLLGSFLVNTTTADVCARLLDCCRRHLAPGGRLLVQRQGPDWFGSRSLPRPWAERGVRTRIAAAEEVSPGVRDVCIEYEVDGDCWSHRFRARDLPDPELDAELRRAGLRTVRYLTDDHSWVEARQAGPGQPVGALADAQGR